jgi:urease beta subunit
MNLALQFDRERAYGMRRDIPAGAASSLEIGAEKEVRLIEFAGTRASYGHNGLINCYLTKGLHLR